MTARGYKPTHGGYPPADRFPGLAVEDGRLGELVERAGDDAAQADALAYLLGECYPNASWSS
jgi:hypothetical protein